MVSYITLRISKAPFELKMLWKIRFDFVFLKQQLEKKVMCVLQRLICYPVFCLDEI